MRRARKRRRSRDQHAVDALAIHVDHFQSQAIPIGGITHAGDAPQFVQNQAGQRAVGARFGGVGVRQIELLNQVGNAVGAVDQPGVFVALDEHVLLILAVAFADFAHQFIDHVFQRDHSFGAAVFVEHHGQLVVLLLKQLQQAVQAASTRARTAPA